jgi:hypothetical protein
MVVEKMLREEGSSRLEMGREAFQERVWQWKAEYGGFITQQMRQIGASCDWSRERFTLDSQLSGELFVTRKWGFGLCCYFGPLPSSSIQNSGPEFLLPEVKERVVTEVNCSVILEICDRGGERGLSAAAQERTHLPGHLHGQLVPQSADCSL